MQKSGFWLALLLIAFLVNKLFFVFKFHNIVWDEAVYFAMGKYLYSFGSVGFWEIVRPIGLPLIIGFFWKLGLDYILTAELVILLFSLFNIYMTYRVAEKVFNSKIALLSAFILAVTPVYFFYSSSILTGIVSTSFCLVALFYFIEKRYTASAIFAALASYFRLPQGLILLALLLAYFIINIQKKVKLKNNILRLARYIFAFILTLSPYLIFNLFIYHDEVTRLHHALLRPWLLGFWSQTNASEAFIAHSPLTTFLGNVFYYFYYPAAGSFEFNGNILLFLLPVALIVFLFHRKWKDQGYLALFTTFLIYYIYFTYITNKQLRFVLVFLPYMAILSAFAFSWIVERFKKLRYLQVALVIVSLSTLIFIQVSNQQFLNWRPDSPPQIYNEYYAFFKGDEPGHIISSDPVLAAYSDLKFIPLYSIWIADNIYEANKRGRYAVVFSPQSFFCGQGDKQCSTMVDEFQRKIGSENRLVFNRSYKGLEGNRTYSIYISENIFK